MTSGSNVCLRDRSHEETINELSKADCIRKLMEKGLTLQGALRELAGRMRLVQKGFEGER